jgi:hypothetical protein
MHIYLAINLLTSLGKIKLVFPLTLARGYKICLERMKNIKELLQ